MRLRAFAGASTIALILIIATTATASAAVDRIVNRFSDRKFATEVEPLQSATDRRSCRPDEKLVGGGVWTGGSAVLSMSAPAANDPRTWVARAYNADPERIGSISTEAVCASSARRDRVKKIVVRSTTKSAQTADPGDAFPYEAFARGICRANPRVNVGGGALATNSTFLLQGVADSNTGEHIDVWWVEAAGTSPFDLTAFTYCVEPSRRDRIRAIRLRKGEPVSISPGESQVALASCRRGEQLVGGGARHRDGCHQRLVASLGARSKRRAPLAGARGDERRRTEPLDRGLRILRERLSA